MTNDKMRQDFEAWAKSEYLIIERYGESYKDHITHFAWKAYQAGRAARDAEIREKLGSMDAFWAVKDKIWKAYSKIDGEDCELLAKAAITKILEVI